MAEDRGSKEGRPPRVNPLHQIEIDDFRRDRLLAEEHPEAVVSLSSQVLREYREYERSVTTLVDAAVKPNIRRYVQNIAHRLAEYATTGGEPREVGPGRGSGSWRSTSRSPTWSATCCRSRGTPASGCGPTTPAQR